MKYGLEFSGRRRVKRGWGWTLLTALTWLTLAALAGWLLHVLRSAAQGTVRTTMGPLPLAMAATGGGVSPEVATWVAWGVLTLCLVGLGVHAWRRVMWHAEDGGGGRVRPTIFPPPPPPPGLKCSVLSAECSEPAEDGSSRMCQCGAMGVEKHAGRAEWMCDLCAFFEAPAEAGTTNKEGESA